MDKKINKSFRFDSSVVNALEDLSKKSGYSQTDLLELSICNLYSMFYGTAGKVTDSSNSDLLIKLEVLRLQFKR